MKSTLFALATFFVASATYAQTSSDTTTPKSNSDTLVVDKKSETDSVNQLKEKEQSVQTEERSIFINKSLNDVEYESWEIYYSDMMASNTSSPGEGTQRKRNSKRKD